MYAQQYRSSMHDNKVLLANKCRYMAILHVIRVLTAPGKPGKMTTVFQPWKSTGIL